MLNEVATFARWSCESVLLPYVVYALFSLVSDGVEAIGMLGDTLYVLFFFFIGRSHRAFPLSRGKLHACKLRALDELRCSIRRKSKKSGSDGEDAGEGRAVVGARDHPLSDGAKKDEEADTSSASGRDDSGLGYSDAGVVTSDYSSGAQRSQLQAVSSDDKKGSSSTRGGGGATAAGMERKTEADTSSLDGDDTDESAVYIRRCILTGKKGEKARWLQLVPGAVLLPSYFPLSYSHSLHQLVSIVIGPIQQPTVSTLPVRHPAPQWPPHYGKKVGGRAGGGGGVGAEDYDYSSSATSAVSDPTTMTVRRLRGGIGSLDGGVGTGTLMAGRPRAMLSSDTESRASLSGCASSGGGNVSSSSKMMVRQKPGSCGVGGAAAGIPSVVYRRVSTRHLDLKSSRHPTHLIASITAHHVLSYQATRQKVLVMDLDETLCYVSTSTASMQGPPTFSEVIPTASGAELFHVWVRPNAQLFLSTMAKLFNLVLFTSASKPYADTILRRIDPDDLIKDRYYRQDCRVVTRGALAKLLASSRNKSLPAVVLDSATMYTPKGAAAAAPGVEESGDGGGGESTSIDEESKSSQQHLEDERPLFNVNAKILMKDLRTLKVPPELVVMVDNCEECTLLNRDNAIIVPPYIPSIEAHRAAMAEMTAADGEEDDAGGAIENDELLLALMPFLECLLVVPDVRSILSYPLLPMRRNVQLQRKIQLCLFSSSVIATAAAERLALLARNPSVSMNRALVSRQLSGKSAAMCLRRGHPLLFARRDHSSMFCASFVALGGARGRHKNKSTSVHEQEEEGAVMPATTYMEQRSSISAQPEGQAKAERTRRAKEKLTKKEWVEEGEASPLTPTAEYTDMELNLPSLLQEWALLRRRCAMLMSSATSSTQSTSSSATLPSGSLPLDVVDTAQTCSDGDERFSEEGSIVDAYLLGRGDVGGTGTGVSMLSPRHEVTIAERSVLVPMVLSGSADYKQLSTLFVTATSPSPSATNSSSSSGANHTMTKEKQYRVSLHGINELCSSLFSNTRHDTRNGGEEGSIADLIAILRTYWQLPSKSTAMLSVFAQLECAILEALSSAWRHAASDSAAPADSLAVQRLRNVILCLLLDLSSSHVGMGSQHKARENDKTAHDAAAAATSNTKRAKSMQGTKRERSEVAVRETWARVVRTLTSDLLSPMLLQHKTEKPSAGQKQNKKDTVRGVLVQIGIVRLGTGVATTAGCLDATQAAMWRAQMQVFESQLCDVLRVSTQRVPNMTAMELSDVFCDALESLRLLQRLDTVLPLTFRGQTTECCSALIRHVCQRAAVLPRCVEGKGEAFSPEYAKAMEQYKHVLDDFVAKTLFALETADKVEGLQGGSGGGAEYSTLYARVCTDIFTAAENYVNAYTTVFVASHAERVGGIKNRDEGRPCPPSVSQIDVLVEWKEQERRAALTAAGLDPSASACCLPPSRPALHNEASKLCYVLLCCGYAPSAICTSGVCTGLSAMAATDVTRACAYFSTKFATTALPARIHQAVVGGALALIARYVRDAGRLVISSSDMLGNDEGDAHMHKRDSDSRESGGDHGAKAGWSSSSLRRRVARGAQAAMTVPGVVGDMQTSASASTGKWMHTRASQKPRRQQRHGALQHNVVSEFGEDEQGALVVTKAQMEKLVDHTLCVCMDAITECVIRGDVMSVSKLVIAIFPLLDSEGSTTFLMEALELITRQVRDRLSTIGVCELGVVQYTIVRSGLQRCITRVPRSSAEMEAALAELTTLLLPRVSERVSRSLDNRLSAGAPSKAKVSPPFKKISFALDGVVGAAGAAATDAKTRYAPGGFTRGTSPAETRDLLSRFTVAAITCGVGAVASSQLVQLHSSVLAALDGKDLATSATSASTSFLSSIETVERLGRLLAALATHSLPLVRHPKSAYMRTCHTTVNAVVAVQVVTTARMAASLTCIVNDAARGEEWRGRQEESGENETESPSLLDLVYLHKRFALAAVHLLYRVSTTYPVETEPSSLREFRLDVLGPALTAVTTTTSSNDESDPAVTTKATKRKSQVVKSTAATVQPDAGLSLTALEEMAVVMCARSTIHKVSVPFYEGLARAVVRYTAGHPHDHHTRNKPPAARTPDAAAGAVAERLMCAAAAICRRSDTTLTSQFVSIADALRGYLTVAQTARVLDDLVGQQVPQDAAPVSKMLRDLVDALQSVSAQADDLHFARWTSSEAAAAAAGRVVVMPLPTLVAVLNTVARYGAMGDIQKHVPYAKLLIRLAKREEERIMTSNCGSSSSEELREKARDHGSLSVCQCGDVVLIASATQSIIIEQQLSGTCVAPLTPDELLVLRRLPRILSVPVLKAAQQCSAFEVPAVLTGFSHIKSSAEWARLDKMSAALEEDSGLGAVGSGESGAIIPQPSAAAPKERNALAKVREHDENIGVRIRVLGAFISSTIRLSPAMTPEGIVACVEAYCRAGMYHPHLFGVLLSRVAEVKQQVSLELVMRLLECGMAAHDNAQVRTACLTAAQPVFISHIRYILQNDPDLLATVAHTSTQIIDLLRACFPQDAISGDVLASIAEYHHSTGFSVTKAALALAAARATGGEGGGGRSASDYNALRILTNHCINALLPTCTPRQVAELVNLLVTCGVRSGALLEAIQKSLLHMEEQQQQSKENGGGAVVDGYTLAKLADALQRLFVESSVALSEFFVANTLRLIEAYEAQLEAAGKVTGRSREAGREGAGMKNRRREMVPARVEAAPQSTDLIQHSVAPAFTIQEATSVLQLLCTIAATRLSVVMHAINALLDYLWLFCSSTSPLSLPSVTPAATATATREGKEEERIVTAASSDGDEAAAAAAAAADFMTHAAPTVAQLSIIMGACLEQVNEPQQHIHLVQCCADTLMAQLSSTALSRSSSPLDLTLTVKLARYLVDMGLAQHPALHTLLDSLYEKRGALLRRQVLLATARETLVSAGRDVHPALYDCIVEGKLL